MEKYAHTGTSTADTHQTSHSYWRHILKKASHCLTRRVLQIPICIPLRWSTDVRKAPEANIDQCKVDHLPTISTQNLYRNAQHLIFHTVMYNRLAETQTQYKDGLISTVTYAKTVL